MATGDDLYALAPEEFVAARDALVRQLKAAGDKETAAHVAKLRRPSVSAWALNQLARTSPDDVARLLDAADALQHRPADVRAAMAAYRDAAKQAGAGAARVLRDAGREPDQHLADIRATLDAAGADPDLADALRVGRLEHAGGFADAVFPVIDVSAGTGAKVAPKEGAPAALADDAATAAEDARAAALAEKAEAAEATLRQRRSELVEADAEVKTAEKALRAAERRIEIATKARERAAAAVARAERDRHRLP